MLEWLVRSKLIVNKKDKMVYKLVVHFVKKGIGYHGEGKNGGWIMVVRLPCCMVFERMPDYMVMSIIVICMIRRYGGWL